METYRRAEPGKPFNITAGQAIAAGEYVLTAVRLPAARQGKIRLRHPSGDFTLLEESSGGTVAFTLHGERNFFGHGDGLVQLLMQRRDAARCIVWPAPAVTLDRAVELARAAVNESGYFHDEQPEKMTHVVWCFLRNVVAGERRLAWEIGLVSREMARSHRGYSGPPLRQRW